MQRLLPLVLLLAACAERMPPPDRLVRIETYLDTPRPNAQIAARAQTLCDTDARIAAYHNTRRIASGRWMHVYGCRERAG